MSSIATPHRRPSPAPRAPAALAPTLGAGADGEHRQPPQSAGRGFRVLRALLCLGAHAEHQLADIARAANLQPSHASKLLKAALQEELVEYGARRGTYRLTRGVAQFASSAVRPGPVTGPIQRNVEHLHQETGLAVAWHEPHYRPGIGLRLTLVDLLCPDPQLNVAAAQQSHDLRSTAAGRAALAYLPDDLAADADGRPLMLPQAVQDSIRSTRIALCRCPGLYTLATPVFRGSHPVGVMSLTGAEHHFQDPLVRQEYAVLLRRAASRAAAPPARRPDRAVSHWSS
ncbi:hypothetical protein [Streptomyces sp. NBC_01601]|uniref:hypothetical protein n=1 Tax=Streptomyces sp. NBC_01601 TaxID=2975892 RepID=UPI002E299EB0|nr:hypothetical protein [Streptomyces sp. NBC_01601]